MRRGRNADIAENEKMMSEFASWVVEELPRVSVAERRNSGHIGKYMLHVIELRQDSEVDVAWRSPAWQK